MSFLLHKEFLMSKKEQMNNHSENNDPYKQDSTDHVPSLNCDAYYLITMLVVIFLPQILLVMPVFFNVSVLFNQKTVYDAMPLMAAVVMFLYAYLCIGRFKLTNPDTIFGIYLPVITYSAWQFLVWVLLNIIGDNNMMLIRVILSFNLYGVVLAIDDMNLQTTELMIWLYNAAILGGFATGERLAFHKISKRQHGGTEKIL